MNLRAALASIVLLFPASFACLVGCSTSTSNGFGHDASVKHDGGTSGDAPSGSDAPGSVDAGIDVSEAGDVPDAPLPTGPFCTYPGSVQFTDAGTTIVPGGASNTEEELKFLHLPPGYCAHFYANVGNPRQIRFAPNGDLFVASPTRSTTAGGPNGENAIVILPDRHNGYADIPVKYATNLPATQGLLFANNSLYFQNAEAIVKVPYANGDHAPSGSAITVATLLAPDFYDDGLHWPKPLDIADDGTIYLGNGGTQGEACVDPHPTHGGIFKLAGSTGDAGALPVAKGFRNAIAVRCQRGHNQCFALELSEDYTATFGGREKFGLIQDGADWGFPCCATQNLLYANLPAPKPANGNADCAGVYAEPVGFLIGDTPFGLAFEPGKWPAPWTGDAFIVLHGEAGGWNGARLVTIAVDSSTGLPVASSDTGGSNTGGMSDFGTGWDDNTMSHGRPGSVEFAADGRLFLANDLNGDIIWIAPEGL